MAKWLVLVGLMFLGTPAQADDWKLIGGGWSHHLDQSDNPTETHDMIGLSYKGASAMRFTNSEGHEAYGVGYEYLPWTCGGLELGGYAGGWTGYEDVDLLIVGGARATYTLGNLGLSVTTAIKVTTFHLEWRL